MQVDPRIDEFLERFVAWASARGDVQAVALVGSYAHQAARPDSDIDLVLFTTAPQGYLEDTAWAGLFGVVSRQQIEDYGKVTSLRVWYSGGPEVEYSISTPEWAAEPVDPGTMQVIQDGMQVLFERRAWLSPVLKK